MESLDRKDFELRIGGDGLEFRTKKLGGQTMAWVVLPKGTDLSPALKGLPGDLCQCPHWGYMIKGRVRMHTANGEREYKMGEAFYWAPGHAPEALEDSEYVDISPTDELEGVIAHVKGE
jgi:hypothetical protein